jgi:hypothetical protein
MTRRGGDPSWLAAGLLLDLAASLTGGGAGSRAVEAKNFRSRAQGSAVLLEVLRRALDAAVEAVTLRACREGTRPLHGDAA